MAKPNVIELKTGDSCLFLPVVIIVDGVEYQCKKLTTNNLRHINELQGKALEGDSEALSNQIQFLFGITKEIADELDVRETVSIMNHVHESILNPSKMESGTKVEKNVQSSEGKN